MENTFLNVEFSDIKEMTISNHNLSHAKLKVANFGKNKKDFNIPKSVFDEAIPTLIGSPVVAHFFTDGELGGHEDDLLRVKGKIRKTGTTHAYGFVDPFVDPYWEVIDGKEWLCSAVYLFTERFPESKEILTANHSMEVKLSIKDVDGRGYANVDYMEFVAVCALNPKGISPTFEGSKFEGFSMLDTQSELEKFKDEIKDFIRNEFSNNNKEVFTLGEMMRKAMMAMMDKYGMQYMAYDMDEKYVYVMDTMKEMAKMKVPYAMMEDGMMAMKYDMMMAMEYADKEMAIKTAMGMMYEKLMEMKNGMDMMTSKYSDSETELNTVKDDLAKANQLISDFSDVSDKESEALIQLTELRASVDTLTIANDELTKTNEQFSADLKVVADEKRQIEAESVLNSEGFSILSVDEKKELIDGMGDMDIELFTLKVKSKAYDKALVNDVVGNASTSNFSTSNLDYRRLRRNDNQDTESTLASEKVKNRKK